MSQSKVTFPMAEAKKAVEDLFEPSALIYWSDFLLNAILGWGTFIAALTFPNFSLQQLALALVAIFCLYRAVIFIHELTHLKKDTFGGFRFAWNLICGFPFMVPSFTYMGVHIDHHKQKMYGTKDDGEYLPFVQLGRLRIVLFFVIMLVVPAVFLIRFLLTPISYIVPPLRKLLWEYLSSLSIDSEWKRPEPQERDGKYWQLQECVTFLYAAVFVTLLVTHILPLKVFVLWYIVAASILVVNGLRTIAATHCYRNPSENILEFAEQVLDSVTVPGNMITTTLWAPVGLRYHAAHHLFPGMPYHNLGKAHYRLMKVLPENSIYRLTLRKSLWHGLAAIWTETAETQKKKKA
ncbi:MAG TPA: fatty acid desaturase [bacterium]|jgi:fatty acid desaturase|nr:fatty acid desaturase [bacterium]